MSDEPRPDFRIVDPVPLAAVSAMCRGLAEVYPDAGLVPSGTGTGFGIVLGDMAEDLPGWMQ